MITRESKPRPVAHSAGQPRARRRRCRARALAVAAIAGTIALAGVHDDARATLLSIDTSALAGVLARLDFSIIDGDAEFGNNSFTITSITTNGSLGVADCSLGCVGGPPFTISDALGLGQFVQDLTLASTLSFEFTFTSNYAGSGAPDRSALLLLDAASNFSLLDTDLDFPSAPVPVQDALLVVDHAPGAGIRIATASNPSVPIAVAEPDAAALVALGLVLLGDLSIRRRRARVSTATAAVPQGSRWPSTDSSRGE